MFGDGSKSSLMAIIVAMTLGSFEARKACAFSEPGERVSVQVRV